MIKYKSDLANVGVQVEKGNGELKSTYEILTELKPKWDAMTDSEKANFQTKVVGLQQGKIFAAIMSQMAVAEKSYNEALNSTGETMRQNAKYMDSIEAKTNIMRAEIEKLVLGEGGLQNLAKGLIDFGTAILKFTNSDIGQLAIKLGTLVGAITLANKAFIVFKGTVLGTNFSTVISLIGQLIVGEVELTTVTNALTTAFLANPLFWGTLAVGGVLALGVALEKTSKTTKELEESIKTLNSQIDELNSKTELTQGDKDKLTYLEKRRDLEQQILDLKVKQIDAESKSASTYLYGGTAESQAPQHGAMAQQQQQSDLQQQRGQAPQQGLHSSEIQKQVQEYKNLTEEIKNFNATDTQSLEILDKKYEKQAQLLSSMENEKKALEGQSDLTRTQTDDLSSLNQVLETTSNNTITYSDAVSQFGEDSEEADTALSDLAKTLKISEEELLANASAMRLSVEQYADYISAMNNVNDNIDSIQSAYKTLTSAIEEYNSTGGYSLDTMQQLLSLDSEYLGMLQMQNGQLVLNEEAIRNKVIAQAEEAKQTIYDTAVNRLNAIANGDNKDATDSSASAKANAVASINAHTTALKADNYQLAINNALEAQGQSAQGDVNKVTAWVRESISAIDSMVAGMGSNFEGTMGKVSKSAKSSAGKTTDAYKEEYQKQKDDLDHALKMNLITEEDYYNQLLELNEKYFGEASGMHEKYLKEYRKNEEDIYKGMKGILDDKLKEFSDAYEKYYKDLISKTKKEKDEFEKAQNAKIKSVEKQRDKELKAIDREIDKLKSKRNRESSYWEEKITAYKSQREELEKQNKLMEYQEALAKAKASKVMTLGASGKFEYGENEALVSEAEQNLAEYQTEQTYQEQLTLLEKSRDDSLSVYDQKIADLEEYRDKVQEKYDEEIANLETYRDNQLAIYNEQIENYQYLVDTFKENQDNLISEELQGVNKESANWKARLQNLKSFINAYNKMLSSLGKAGKKVSFNYDAIKSNDIISEIQNSDAITAYASGVSSVGDNQVALVGDSPNRELVVGSRLNGIPMQLSKGSGVVNAKSTNTLAGILNNLGSLGGNAVSNYSNNNSRSTSINIANLNVQTNNGQQLVDYLKSYGSQMTQEAYSY